MTGWRSSGPHRFTYADLSGRVVAMVSRQSNGLFAGRFIDRGGWGDALCQHGAARDAMDTMNAKIKARGMTGDERDVLALLVAAPLRRHGQHSAEACPLFIAANEPGLFDLA
jgi:hypothetical protein